MALLKRLSGRGDAEGGKDPADWMWVSITLVADSITTWDPWTTAGCGPGSSCRLADLGDPYLTLIFLASSRHTQEPRGQGDRQGLWDHRALPRQLGSNTLPTRHVLCEEQCTLLSLREASYEEALNYTTGLRQSSQARFHWWERRNLDIVTV